MPLHQNIKTSLCLKIKKLLCVNVYRGKNKSTYKQKSKSANILIYIGVKIDLLLHIKTLLLLYSSI